MTRVAVTKGTLRIPPTYFAIQHTERLLGNSRANPDTRLAIRTFAMAVDITDPSVRNGGLDIREITIFPWASFRLRELTMPLSFGRMTRAIIDFAPEVIHQHFATWSTPSVDASQQSGARLLVTLHGSDVFAALRPLSAVPLSDRPMLAWHHASVDRVFRQAQRLLPVSRYLADRAIAAGADPARIEVHYQGVDTEFFAPAWSELARSPSPRASDAIPSIVFVGTLSHPKGVVDLISASTGLIPRVPHRLVMIGRGPLEGTVRDAAREYPHIEPVGSLEREEVRARMRDATVLVLPTTANNGAREAAGLVLLEAQACGVPVITYDSGGAPEMLDDGRTGFVVPDRDVTALADAIRQIMVLSDAERQRLGDAARDWVVANRSLAQSTKQLGELYADAAR